MCRKLWTFIPALQVCDFTTEKIVLCSVLDYARLNWQVLSVFECNNCIVWYCIVL